MSLLKICRYCGNEWYAPNRRADKCYRCIKNSLKENKRFKKALKQIETYVTEGRSNDTLTLIQEEAHDITEAGKYSHD